MKGIIKILDGSGHSAVEYDTEVPASLEVAQETIKRAKAEHKVVFDGGTKEAIPGKWDPQNQEETLVIPPMAGGA
jgi:tRNA/tmRNA/rRNA uracil-C5-methylase (TrmA/RlmC/RlmD family)